MLRPVIFIAVVLLPVVCTNLFAQDSQWYTDYETAMTEAKRSNRPLLISFAGSDWCKPCIKFTREVFDTDDFKKYADQKLVMLLLDFPRLKKNRLSKEQQQHNDKLASRFNKTGEFPLVVIIDSNEKILAKTGYQSGGGKAFIAFLDKTLN